MLIGFLLFASAAISQTQPVFEVASVRPHSGPLGGSGAQLEGNRLTMIGGSSLRQLIAYAYDLKIYQYVGGPDWANGPLETNSFDVIAQTGSGAVLTAPQAKQALQVLLAERFHLRVHWETKEMPVFVLVIGKNGPKFSASKSDVSLATRGTVTWSGYGDIQQTKYGNAGPSAFVQRRPACPRSNRVDWALRL